MDSKTRACERELFEIVLRTESGDWPGTTATRLRHALKCLLRAYGLRAVSARELPVQNPVGCVVGAGDEPTNPVSHEGARK